MTNLPDLIIQLCDELDHSHQCLLDDRRLTHPLADKARAALAEPAPEMIEEHPVIPPPELVQRWWTEFERTEPDTDSLVFIATQAARWGADQELKACYEWIVRDWTDIQSADMLLNARRPKPPSLKEQALQALENADGADHPVVATVLTADQHALIRKALEQLDD